MLLKNKVKELFIFWNLEKETKVIYETLALKLEVALSDLTIDDAITKEQHTKHGDTKYFNRPKLNKLFTIGILIDLEDKEEKLINNENQTNYDNDYIKFIEV